MRRSLGILAVLIAACSRVEEPECGTYSALIPAPIQKRLDGAAQVDSVNAPPTVHLELNIPAYEVRVIHGDSVVGSYRVAVGSPSYPTRTGSFMISSITWNPWWRPPASEWARDEKKAPPGPRNPMGKVKLNYGDAYYLHGTPDSTRLERPVSHGCVRMQNADAIDLAFRLQDVLGLNLPASETAELMADWEKERTIVLKPGVPLEIRYEIVELRDSVVLTYGDIYQRETKPLAELLLIALQRADIGDERIDSAAVRAFVRSARTGGETPVQSLLRND